MKRGLPRVRLGLLLVLVMLAGCAAPVPAGRVGVEPAFQQDHDHWDRALHDVGEGLDVVSYHNLVPGEDRSAAARGDWLNSEVVVRNGLAFVSMMGAPWLLSIVDVSNASDPRLLGALPYRNAWGMDVAASDDGAWVFVAVYPDASTLTGAGPVLGAPRLAQSSPTPGVVVVDARVPEAPALSSFFPLHGLGPHTLTYHATQDGRELVVLNKADLQGGNGLLIAQVVESPSGGRVLEPRSFFMSDDAIDTDFPHDVEIQQHPVTGQLLLYAAYWDAGLVILDVTDPSAPMLVGRSMDVPGGEELQIHDVHPYPRLVGGRHYALTGPEMPGGHSSGHLRVWDTTDPARPTLVSSWIMPGAFVVTEPFLFSMHNFQFTQDGQVAVAHGHAGVWIVDWLDESREAPRAEPVATAYRVPVVEGAPRIAWNPTAGAPWMWGTAIGPDGTVWATDTGSGLYALRMR